METLPERYGSVIQPLWNVAGHYGKFMEALRGRYGNVAETLWGVAKYRALQNVMVRYRTLRSDMEPLWNVTEALQKISILPIIN